MHSKLKSICVKNTLITVLLLPVSNSLYFITVSPNIFIFLPLLALYQKERRTATVPYLLPHTVTLSPSAVKVMTAFLSFSSPNNCSLGIFKNTPSYVMPSMVTLILGEFLS